MALDDPLHDREADARAFVLLRAVQPLEDAEKFVRVAHVEAGAVVADEIDILAVLRLAADFDDCLLDLARVLERVGKQVDPNLPEQRRVAPARWQFAQADRSAVPPAGR